MMRINDSSSEEEDVSLNYLTADLFLLVFGKRAKEIYVTRS